MYVTCPCKSCGPDDRYHACHNSCEAYIKYKNWKEAEKDERRKQRQVGKDLYCHHRDAVDKWVKKTGGKK